MFLESWEMNWIQPQFANNNNNNIHNIPQHPNIPIANNNNNNNIPNIPNMWINPKNSPPNKKSKKIQGGSVFINDASVPRSRFLRPIRFVDSLPPVEGSEGWRGPRLTMWITMVCVWVAKKKRHSPWN